MEKTHYTYTKFNRTYLSLNITPSIQAPNNTIQERSINETQGRLHYKNIYMHINATIFLLRIK